MKRYKAQDLRKLVAGLAGKMGLAAEMAEAMAARVVDAELLGHRTHGLLFFPAYLERLEKGAIAKSGKHEVLSLTIDPAVLKEDVELVQDLVVAAVNEGIRNAQKMVAEEMTKATGGLKIPGLG